MDKLFKHFSDLNDIQIEQFEQLEALYGGWNTQINVISRKDMDQFYERHVLHSLGISKVIEFKNGSTVLDVGTGGGFPGIPLAILFPDCNFTLVDSIAKKIHVVDSIVDSLKLDIFVGMSFDIPITFAPKSKSQIVSQVPLKPVCPVINTILLLNVLYNLLLLKFIKKPIFSLPEQY